MRMEGLEGPQNRFKKGVRGRRRCWRRQVCRSGPGVGLWREDCARSLQRCSANNAVRGVFFLRLSQQGERRPAFATAFRPNARGIRAVSAACILCRIMENGQRSARARRRRRGIRFFAGALRCCTACTACTAPPPQPRPCFPPSRAWRRFRGCGRATAVFRCQ